MSWKDWFNPRDKKQTEEEKLKIAEDAGMKTDDDMIQLKYIGHIVDAIGFHNTNILSNTLFVVKNNFKDAAKDENTPNLMKLYYEKASECLDRCHQYLKGNLLEDVRISPHDVFDDLGMFIGSEYMNAWIDDPADINLNEDNLLYVMKIIGEGAQEFINNPMFVVCNRAGEENHAFTSAKTVMRNASLLLYQFDMINNGKDLIQVHELADKIDAHYENKQ